MNARGCRTIEDRANAHERWRELLSDILSVFGRLVYLSSLRDSDTGLYRQWILAHELNEEEMDRVIRQTHRECFAEWLNFNLEQQKADLDLYLTHLGMNRRSVLEAWAEAAPYRHLVPPGAEEMERNLFLSDLGILIELLRKEYAIKAAGSEFGARQDFSFRDKV